MRTNASAMLAMCAVLAGCSLALPTQLPNPPIAPSWPVGDAYLAQSEAALPTVSYRDIFHDPRLQALVEQALVNNRDLRVAAANLAAARAQVRVLRADQFPAIGVSTTGSYAGGGSSNSSRSSTGTATGTGTGTGIGTGSGSTTGSSSQAYRLQGGISSFELDLFGRLANATEAQRQRALSTEAAARTVRLGLVSDLASAWATYAADQDLLANARATSQSAARSVMLTCARLEGGIAPRTDLSQALQIEAIANGDVARQVTAIAQDRNLVRLLVGADVDPALLPANLQEVIASTEALPAGTSSQVLLRRPDVVEAEYDLRASNAEIGVARAELFPTITLTGLAGFASDTLGGLFKGGNFSYGGSGDAGYSIFNAGGRIANVRVTQAQRDAALANYERAVQIAFREVSDALAEQGTIAEQQRAAAVNSAAAADTARLTEARYLGGIDSYLSSLDAQRSLYSARRSEISVRLALVNNRVTLYRVLGGDQASTATPSPR